MKFTLLVLTLNEIEGMKAIMPQIDRSWVDQVLVVDGGSTDGTAEWARKQGYDVYIQKRKGLRHAYTEAMPLVTGDVFIPFSPDGNSEADRIPPLIEKMREGYDMVTVSRYLDDASSEDDDWVTSIGNWIFTKIVNLLYGSNYTDAMVMYRGIRKEVFYKLELHKDEGYEYAERLFRTDICIMPLLSVRAAKAKLCTTEIPGDEPARIGSERKLQIFRWGAAYLYQFIKEKFFWVS